jgi:excisionase family DNA binding protein
MRGGEKVKTAKEVSKELKVSIGTVYKWVRKGKIKAVKIDKAIRIPEEELKAKARGVK